MGDAYFEKIIEDFEAATKNAEKAQKETLRKILEENGETEYLKKFGLNGRTDPETFKSCVPLCDHSDLEPYIQRIMDGDNSPILTQEPITKFTLSSGTTQRKLKMFPFNEYLLNVGLQLFQTSFAFRDRAYRIDDNAKSLQLIYASKSQKTKGGHFIRPLSANLCHNPEFEIIMKYMKSQCCSPDEVISAPDIQQSLYCHFLCALIYRDDIQLIDVPFAYSVIQAFQVFEQTWEELCNDIRTGILSSRITIPSVRDAMSKILKPNPELADVIHKKCLGLVNWYGVIPEIFPNIKYVYAILTGSMEPYVKKLSHYAGRIPLVSADYCASEGWLGINVNPTLPPENVTFAVHPEIAYYEFIPAATCADIDPKPIGLSEVKVGEEYEILFTNSAGMYRYRIGDVVKVKSFHNSTPELQFICRKSLLLTVNIDKNTERDLQVSVEAAGKLLVDEKVEVVDYTSHVDRSTDPGHYVIFWELNGEPNDEVLQECCNRMDRTFVEPGYTSSRKAQTIGPVELRVVKKGTFQKLLDHSVSRGTSLNQYKSPRIVGNNNQKVFEILCENVDKSYFSDVY